MKSLSALAALAVAYATAHGSFADAIAQGRITLQPFRNTVSNLTKISGDKHCTSEINAWRKKVDPAAADYQPNLVGVPTTDLSGFFDSKECSVLKEGKYTHIHEHSGDYTFIFSASQKGATMRNEMTCAEAVEQWKTGFSAFKGQYPGVFKQDDGAYADPNAVGLVGMLIEGDQNIFCGNPTGCEPGTLVCYIKPSPVTAGNHPVGADLWHKVEESFTLKPKVTAHENNQDCVDAVNAIRSADGLNLAQFAVGSGERKLILKQARSPSTPYKDALYNLTCEEVNGSSIDPKVESEYTLIYAVKDGLEPPTADEAVEFWKTGYKKLGPSVPPAFKTKVGMRAEAQEGDIYYNSAVAGFASLMVDGSREMWCYNATGCKKAALICFLSGPTLVENTQPISGETWQKILALASEESGESIEKNIKFTIRNEAENCLTEINQFRTQDSLALRNFVAKVQTSTGATPEEIAETESVELAKVFNCDVFQAGNAPILFSSNKRSVMYYFGSSAMCSNAVTEWKKGYEKFKDVTIPPMYNSTAAIYKTGAATNFISLVSEGDDTVARCYTVDGCTEGGLLCVLEPAVFEDGALPITETTWKKVTKTFSSGVRDPSIHGALLGSVFVVASQFALNF